MTTYNTIQRALRDLLVALDVDPDDVGALNDASAPESAEPDPWPTAPLIVASVDGGGPELLSIITSHAAVAMTGAIVRRTEHTLANVVPVTVVPAAALPVLWSALEQWLNGHSDPDADANRLVGAVINLRGQIDALGVDL